ncbi:MAG: serine hydrolase [Opitutae bacterium]|nr:serine hydrolase [Opitutae bacterium]
MRKPILRFTTLLCAILSGFSTAAEKPEFDDALRRMFADVPGGAVIARKDAAGKVDILAIGRRSAADAAPMTADTVFEIGSITKMFTGLLLAQAVVEGRVTLDDTLARHLPGELVLPPDVAAITLGQLATHTSGLPRLPADLSPANASDPYAGYGEASLHASLQNCRLTGPAPQPAAYSNLGIGLLGHLLTRVYGVSYEDLLREKITRPLGLTDTVVTLDGSQQARFAKPHSGSQRVANWTFDALAGAGAIRSTAADLLRFVGRLTAADSPLKAAWELARQPRADFPAYAGKVGLCILMSGRGGKLLYGHDGGTGGYRSHLEFSTATGEILAVLINNDAPEGLAVAAKIREWEQPATSKPPSGPVEQTITPGQLAEYTGVYEIDGAASFTARIDRQGRLVVRLTGQPFFPVFHMGNDRFFLKVVAAEYQFARDGDGRIESLTLHQSGQQVPARRTAKPVPTVLALTAAQLAAYAGTYELAPGILFEVKASRENLFVKLTGQPAYPVFGDREDHFVYDVVEAALTFVRGADGKVEALILHQNGRDQRAARVP